MNTIAARGLSLEPQLASHAAEMFVVLSDPAIYEFENEPPQSLEWLASRFARLESRASDDGSELWLNWVVRLESGAPAGFVQATVEQPCSVAHVAYVLSSQYWGRGIGSAAVQAMLAHLVWRYQVRDFLATLKAKNSRSLALLQRLGFTPGAPARLGQRDVEPDELLMHKAVPTNAG